MQLERPIQATKSVDFAYAHGRASGIYIGPVALICLCLSLSASRLAANEVTTGNEIAGNAAFTSGLAGRPFQRVRMATSCP